MAGAIVDELGGGGLGVRADQHGGHADRRGPVDGLLDDLLRFDPATPMRALDRFARLKVLVRLEEVLDLQPVERADVLQFLNVSNPGVVRRHHQDLVVSAGLIGHVEQSDRTRPDQASGEGRLLEQDQCVQRVPVLA